MVRYAGSSAGAQHLIGRLRAKSLMQLGFAAVLY
jgi:hypothetical protein